MGVLGRSIIGLRVGESDGDGVMGVIIMEFEEVGSVCTPTSALSTELIATVDVPASRVEGLLLPDRGESAPAPICPEGTTKFITPTAFPFFFFPFPSAKLPEALSAGVTGPEVERELERESVAFPFVVENGGRAR